MFRRILMAVLLALVMPLCAKSAPMMSDVKALNLRDGAFWYNASNNTQGAKPQAFFTQIKSCGFNAVRIAVQWETIERSRGNFSSGARQSLLAVMARAKQAGLQVILDNHIKSHLSSIPAWAKSAPYIDMLDIFARGDADGITAELARLAAADSNVIAFDLVNELVAKGGWDTRLATVYTRLHGIARNAGYKGIILVEPQNGGNLNPVTDWSTLKADPKVVYSPHIYFGGGHVDGFSSSGWQSVGVHVYDGNTGYPNTSTKAQLAAHLRRHIAYWGDANRIWVGEFGINLEATGAERWITEMREVLDEHRIGWAWWCDVDNAACMAIFRPPYASFPYTVHRLITKLTRDRAQFVASIAMLKGVSYVSPLMMSSKPVTLAPTSAGGVRTTSYFYVEEPDRCAGIRVDNPIGFTDALRVGDAVNLTGILATTAAGERCLHLTVNPTSVSQATVGVMGVNTRAIQTDDMLVGLLVRVVGVIRSLAGDRTSFMMADGYSAFGDEELTKVVAVGSPLANGFAVGDFVSVNGIVSKDAAPSSVAKVLLMRDLTRV